MAGLADIIGTAGSANPVGMALGVGAGLFGIAKGIQSMRQAKKINPIYNPYQVSQYAKDQLGGAQTALNARNQYAEAQQRGILGSQSNAMASAQRNVTDPSQLLAMASAGQANTNQAMFQQGLQEQQAYQQRLSSLTGAQQVMTGEGDKVYQDMRAKYQIDAERKAALQNAGAQSVLGGLQGMAGMFLATGDSAPKSSSGYLSMANLNNQKASRELPGMISGFAPDSRGFNAYATPKQVSPFSGNYFNNIG